MKELQEKIEKFNEERDWNQFYSPENLAKKYPFIENSKGKSTKYNKL